MVPLKSDILLINGQSGLLTSFVERYLLNSIYYSFKRTETQYNLAPVMSGL